MIASVTPSFELLDVVAGESFKTPIAEVGRQVEFLDPHIFIARIFALMLIYLLPEFATCDAGNVCNVLGLLC